VTGARDAQLAMSSTRRRAAQLPQKLTRRAAVGVLKVRQPDLPRLACVLSPRPQLMRGRCMGSLLPTAPHLASV
jgi:hypothetical protein